MKKFGLGALAAAGLVAGGLSIDSATAADFGGDCCADLEERVAELEATTVRKGNRKVSLTISGWVAEQVMYWDDGAQSDVYVTGLGTTLASNFKFTGGAQITPDWSAGYVMHIEADTADPLLVDQNNDDTAVGVNIQQAYWFLKSQTFGQLSVGQLNPASDNTAILVDGSGSLVPANWVLFDNNSFFLRRNGVLQGARWGDLAHCNTSGAGAGLGVSGDCGAGAVPGNYVRYDSPTFAGFSFSADWGEDDAWDVALRYAGTLGDFKLATAASFYRNSEYRTAAMQGADVDYFQIGAYLQHNPTGLFIYGAYGYEDTEGAAAARANFDSEAYYLKAGLRQKFTQLGHSVFYGEFGQHLDTQDVRSPLPDAVTGSEMTRWGLGFVQEIDAAAMSLFLNYRHFDAEMDRIGGGTIDYDDFHVVKGGALIAF